MEGEDELDLGEEIEETEELSSPPAAEPDIPSKEEKTNNEGSIIEEKNGERSEPGSIKNLEDMLNKLLEAVQFTDRRCQAIEKKIEGVPEKNGSNKKVINNIVPESMKENTKNTFKKKISSIIVLSQSDDYEIALEKIGEEAQDLLKMVNEDDHNET
ncbi:MAG: hypothetical protein U0M86_08480 [Dialister invisus]|uniref:hypothetical protein n=1 Tax=Dialister invisus TaxID=218538 RepID=UPI002F91D4BC